MRVFASPSLTYPSHTQVNPAATLAAKFGVTAVAAEAPTDLPVPDMPSTQAMPLTFLSSTPKPRSLHRSLSEGAGIPSRRQGPAPPVNNLEGSYTWRRHLEEQSSASHASGGGSFKEDLSLKYGTFGGAASQAFESGRGVGVTSCPFAHRPLEKPPFSGPPQALSNREKTASCRR